MDNIIVSYEEQLRENASLEKVFRYFASLNLEGRDVMTPLDMVRALTPGVPPMENTRPSNIPMPLFHRDDDEIANLSKTQCPDFFKFNSDADTGMISYGRFLIFLALLSIPSEQLRVLFDMTCGSDDEEDGSRRMKSTDLDLIISRHVKIRNQEHKYDATQHSNGSVFRRIFDPDLKRELTFEEFKALHDGLKSEVLKLEYYLLSDGEDHMSLVGFARSVACLTPLRYRAKFNARVEMLANGSILIPRTTSSSESIKHTLASNVVVTLEEYGAWKECLKQLDALETAVFYYSQEDGKFTPTSLRRAAKAVAGVELSREQVFVLFELFDPERTGHLSHDQFGKLLKLHTLATPHPQPPDGLGLAALGACCKTCFDDWLDGNNSSKAASSTTSASA